MGNHRSALLAIYVASFVGGFARFPLWILLTLYLSQYGGMSYLEIGAIFTAQGLAAVPFTLWAGGVADRMGRRIPMLSSIGVSIASYSVMLFSVVLQLSIVLLIVSFFAQGIAVAVQRPFSSAIATDISDPERRVSVFGNRRIASNAGIGVGMIASGVAYYVSVSVFFLIPAVGSVIEFILYFWKVKESLPSLEGKLQKPGKTIDRRMISTSVVFSFALLVTLMFLTPMIPLYFGSVDGFSPIETTAMYALNTLIVVVFQIPVNMLAARIGENKTVTLGLALYGIGYFCLGIFHGLAEVSIITVIMSFGENMVMPMIQSIISKIAPPDRRGAYFGTYGAISGLVSPFGSIIGTSMIQYFAATPVLTWIILAVFAFVMALTVTGFNAITRKSAADIM